MKYSLLATYPILGACCKIVSKMGAKGTVKAIFVKIVQLPTELSKNVSFVNFPWSIWSSIIRPHTRWFKIDEIWPKTYVFKRHSSP